VLSRCCRFSKSLITFFLGIVLVLQTASWTVAAPSTFQEIQKNKLLKVCIWPDYFGISYRNSRTNVLEGVDIDLSHHFANDLKVRLEYVETNFQNFMEDLAAKKCHIAMMVVGITPERLQKVKFSAPYLRSDIYAVALKSNRSIRTWEDIDRSGKVVVVQKGTFMEPVLKEFLKQATVYSATKPGEREKEVESGRADVFATDYPYSQRMLKNTDWAKVIPPDKPIRLTDYAYAVLPGDEEWLARVNQFVQQIKKDGRLDKAAATYQLTPIVVKD